MKVFLGGTVNGSKWRSRVKEELIVDYFDPVVDDWNDAAYERELSERRNCDYLLYVLTPKITGYYAVAEVTDDSYRRPDRTLYCFLEEDEEDRFSPDEIEEFNLLGEVVTANGAKWLKSIDEVITFLNASSSQILEEEGDVYYDAFISYGKRESFDFTNKLSNQLADMDYNVFHDANDIPFIVENEQLIYDNILKSDNFIYVITPNAVRSEYCEKELDFAIKYKKRIIPVQQSELKERERLDDIVAMKSIIQYDHTDSDLQKVADEISVAMKKDKSYIHLHSKLMFQARNWQSNGRPQGDLLYGKERSEAVDWLEESSQIILPLQMHYEFIEASKSLSFMMLILLWLERQTRFFTKLKWFDKITLMIGMGNPIAMAFQLKELIFSPDAGRYESVSVPMWSLFFLIQLTLTFVGIKSKDLGLFISMVLSGLISLSVIALVLANG